MPSGPDSWRHAEDCWQVLHKMSTSDTNCTCGLTDVINLHFGADKPVRADDIPVCMIGPWGTPVPVGKAIFRGTKDVYIQLDDHQLVEEFYDLDGQELIVSISFRYASHI